MKKMMFRYVYLIFLPLIACQFQSKCEIDKNCYPFIVYKLKSDTVLVGQNLEGFFSLSDTSWSYGYDGNRKIRVVPIAMVNGNRIFSRTDTIHFSIALNAEEIKKNVERKILILELTVPNPNRGEITFTERVPFYVKMEL